MHDAGILARLQPAQRRITLAEARQPAAGHALGIALDNICVVVAEIDFEIGLGLAPGGRGPRIDQQTRLSPGNTKRLAAPLPNRVVERDAAQISGAALPLGEDKASGALAIELATGGGTLDVPEGLPIGEAADAQRGVSAGDQK